MLPGAFSFGAESPLEAGAWSPYWWLHGRDSLVTHDMAFAQTLTGSVLRDDRGVRSELVFHVPGCARTGAARSQRAARVARMRAVKNSRWTTDSSA